MCGGEADECNGERMVIVAQLVVEIECCQMLAKNDWCASTIKSSTIITMLLCCVDGVVSMCSTAVDRG
jgi:hypothetical protein